MATIDVNVILPFFFVLAIVYGALEVSKVFQNKGVKAIIALVIAFFASTSPPAVEFIFFILPYAAMFFVVFFFVGFLLSFFKDKGEKDYALIMVILALVLIFISGQDNLKFINLQDQNFVGMIVLLVIALILYSAYNLKSS